MTMNSTIKKDNIVKAESVSNIPTDSATLADAFLSSQDVRKETKKTYTKGQIRINSDDKYS